MGWRGMLTLTKEVYLHPFVDSVISLDTGQVLERRKPSRSSRGRGWRGLLTLIKEVFFHPFSDVVISLDTGEVLERKASAFFRGWLSKNRVD